jgi:Skp family chaperone for outer membrane proteins
MIASDSFSDLRTQLVGIREEAQPLVDEVNNLVATIRVGAIDATEFQNRYNMWAALFEQFDQVVTAAASTKLLQAIEKVAREEGVDLVLQRKDVILYRRSTTVLDITEEVKAEIRGYL